MKFCNYIYSILLTIMFLSPIFGANCYSQKIPHLKKNGDAIQLIVDDVPYLVLGGELHNSTSSNLEYMEPRLKMFTDNHLNTVLASVCWDLFEPVEGQYDFSLVDGLINAARRNNLRVSILWFASWKNGVSSYVPLWVKTNTDRFPRAKNKDGRSLDIISTFSDECRDADARAFAALMKHICEIDGEQHTVVMVQVQNEVGVLGDSRDRNAMANEAFNNPVPKEFISYLKKNKEKLVPGFLKKWELNGYKTSGNWEEIFGSSKSTDEIFMAWNYARYVNKITEAGKAEYPLPMFVNVWLADWRPSAEMTPGVYPSGGPLPYMMDVWNAGAPAIDILAPDIYSNFTERCDLYHRYNNPLLIPEMVRTDHTIGAIFYALGQHDAIGFSPFGMESLPEFTEKIGEAYQFISTISPIILEHQGKDVTGGAFLGKDHPKESLIVGDYKIDLSIARHYSFPTPDYPSGIFIQVGPDEYLVGGRGLNVKFNPITPGEYNVGVASVEDGEYINGRWVAGRILNGDEILSGRGVRLRGDYYMTTRIKLYRYR